MSFEDAYRFAKGEVVDIDGQKAQLETPLDFLVIADYAEGFGIINELKNGNPALMNDTLFLRWNKMLNGTKEQSAKAGKEMPEALDKGILPPSINNPKIIGPIMTSIWGNYLKIADRYNEPGKFTALADFEWSSMPSGNNLHHIVVFRDDMEKLLKRCRFHRFKVKIQKIYGII